MYDYNFKRVEEKYLLQASLKEKFLFKISDYIDKDKFFISNIHNIWVDTDNNDLFINLLDKPLFKNKFRARYYGEGNEVFLETKIKYNGIVSKRRFKLQIDDFNQYMNLDETLRAGGDLGMAVGLSFNINSTNRIKQRAKDAVKHTVYAWLNSKYRAEEYKKNPYKGKEVISANTTESFNWVRPLFIDVNIALGATILGLILFGVLDITSLLRKEKENEKLQ